MIALVHGAPRFDSDWIEAPIGRSRKRSDRMSVIEPPTEEEVVRYREMHGEPLPAPGFRTREGARMHSQIMVRSL